MPSRVRKLANACSYLVLAAADLSLWALAIGAASNFLPLLRSL